MLKMKKISEKYALNYESFDKTQKFKFIKEGQEKRNIISGILNGFEIKIYDYHIKTSGRGGYIRYTKFIKNGKLKDLEHITTKNIDELLHKIQK
jgi:hypothetical protein